MNKNELFTLFDNLFPDNTSGLISPADLRQGLQQITSSNLNLDELTQQDALGQITSNGAFVDKVGFLALSQTAFTVSGDAANPSYMPIDSLLNISGIELFDGPTGAIKNVSGRTIIVTSGTISFNPDRAGGGTSTLNLVSEKSGDEGVSWIGNLNSLRKIEVASNNESFQTKISLTVNWAPNEILRFRVYETGGGSIDFIPTSETILGQPFTGASMIWELEEG